MDVEIRKLTPDLAEDYAAFFDTTPHNEKYKVKCYCVCWCGEDCEGKDLSTKKARRDYALRCVADGRIQGYFAYYGGVAVGWCNANTKSDCLKCAGWRGMNGVRRGFIPTEESTPEIKVKSIFCFVVAPEMRRRGVASLLLARVCGDAAGEGFDYAEAYPEKEITDKSEDFMGHAEMYKKFGFTTYHETKRKLVMRKKLRT